MSELTPIVICSVCGKLAELEDGWPYPAEMIC